MPVVEKSGKFGTATIAATLIGITEWTAKIIKEFADSTDSTNYDSVSQQTYGAQVPGIIRAEGTVKGNFDFNATSSAVVQKLKTDAVLAAIFALDRSTNFISCNVDLTDVEVGVT